jgi:hypothetical protein
MDIPHCGSTDVEFMDIVCPRSTLHPSFAVLLDRECFILLESIGTVELGMGEGVRSGSILFGVLDKA